jgi:thermostable 8-oxoguanine DNA glycosylase
MNYPGRIREPFLSRTMNELAWTFAEDDYRSYNKYGMYMVKSEHLYNNRYALHILTKTDNGEFVRDLILIDGNFLNQYRSLY